MLNNSQYIIADRCLQLSGEALVQAVAALPGFEPFRAAEALPADVQVDYVPGQEVPTAVKQLYTLTAEGVDTVFSTTADGYVLQMVHEDGAALYLWSDAQRRQQYLKGDLLPLMLRFALWMAYGLGSVASGRIALHGSCIVNAGTAYIFLGESGTGKSTHTRLWREYIPGSSLLNDDSPIVAVDAESVQVYGSPWSGKTPCYKSAHYRLGGCVRLSQAPYNHMERLSVFQAFTALHPSCPPQFAYDEALYEGICESLNDLLTLVPVYHLACLPDREAAQLSFHILHENED